MPWPCVATVNRLACEAITAPTPVNTMPSTAPINICASDKKARSDVGKSGSAHVTTRAVQREVKEHGQPP